MAHKDRTLALFFSHGITLEIWKRQGLFDREVGYYRRLADYTGHEVTFVTYDRPGAELDALACDAEAIDVLCNRWGLDYRLFGLLAPLLHYRSLRRCEVIKTNQLSGAWSAAIAKLITRRPLIVRCGYIWSRNAIRQGVRGIRARAIIAIEGWVLRRANLIFVAIKEDQEYLVNTHRISSDNIVVLPNPVDTEIFRPNPSVPKQAGLIACVGRLSPEKNLQLLVRSVVQIPDTRLILIGHGPCEQGLKALAEGCERVEFKGMVANSDIPSLLQKAEIFVLPSNFEGSPKALLEAMSCGLPVIGTNVPGIRDVIKHNENGLLCESNVESMCEAIRRMLADSNIRQRLGQQARLFIEQTHSQDSIAHEEASLITKVTGEWG